MRLALCLSGQARSYKAAYPYIKKNLLDLYDVDVFLHSWKRDNLKERELVNLYEPVAFQFDYDLAKDINNDLQVVNGSHPANFCTSMFYSIYKANDLKVSYELGTEFTYDFVIRSRFDFALNTQFNFENLDRNTIYVSLDAEGQIMLNDQFAIGSSANMDTYSSTYLNLRSLYNKGYKLCGHDMLAGTRDLFGLNFQMIDFNHPFVDGNYNRGRHSIIRDDMHEWVDVKIWGY